MLIKKRYIVVFAVLLTFVAVYVGCKHHASPDEKIDRFLSYLTDDMDLTPKQGEMLNQFKTDLKARFIKIRSEKKQTRNEIFNQLKSETMDQQKVTDAVAGVKTEIDKMIPFMISRIAEFHGTLTEDQRNHLVEKLEGLRKLHGGD